VVVRFTQSGLLSNELPYPFLMGVGSDKPCTMHENIPDIVTPFHDLPGGRHRLAKVPERSKD